MAQSIAIKRHLKQNVTTLCTLWKMISLMDGSVLAAANHVRDIVYQNVRYRAIPINPTQLQRRAGLSPDNAELIGILRRGGITEFDVSAGRWKGAAVEMNTVNYIDLS